MTQQPQQPVTYHQIVKAPSNGMAVTSLILGIVAVVIGIWSPIPIIGIVPAFIAFLPSVLAAVFGHIGLSQAAKNGVGRGHALTGMILGYVALAIIIFVTLFWFIAIVSSGVDASYSS